MRQLRSFLKSLDADIDGPEVAVAILNGLPQHVENVNMALDVLDDDTQCSTLELVKGKILPPDH